jgi:glycosyltransferase involved in cell wall biosynthesis|tara:strand:+ start:167 stop:1063 length:897 start_codon:yes stop_codon:yes gene_type:complete
LNTLKHPIVSIGLPVYNGEDFLKYALDSLLSQTFRDFELIISDNASTDNTPKICQEYVLRDKRIRYIRQNNNMGALWNFNFVLKQSNKEYFIWVSSDDKLHPEFLEKNIDILEKNKNVVCSIGDVIYSDVVNYEFKSNNETKKTFRQRYVKSTYGTYESKVRTYLKFFQASMMYGLYRRDKLQKSITINKIFLAFDLSIILNVLKYGDFHVIDENLLHRYNKGSHSIIGTLRKYDISLINIIFLEFPFTFWCLKNLGFKNFVKNFDLFLKINIRGGLIILFETIRISKRIVFRQDMFW